MVLRHLLRRAQRLSIYASTGSSTLPPPTPSSSPFLDTHLIEDVLCNLVRLRESVDYREIKSVSAISSTFINLLNNLVSEKKMKKNAKRSSQNTLVSTPQLPCGNATVLAGAMRRLRFKRDDKRSGRAAAMLAFCIPRIKIEGGSVGSASGTEGEDPPPSPFSGIFKGLTDDEAADALWETFFVDRLVVQPLSSANVALTGTLSPGTCVWDVNDFYVILQRIAHYGIYNQSVMGALVEQYIWSHLAPELDAAGAPAVLMPAQDESPIGGSSTGVRDSVSVVGADGRKRPDIRALIETAESDSLNGKSTETHRIQAGLEPLLEHSGANSSLSLAEKEMECGAEDEEDYNAVSTPQKTSIDAVSITAENIVRYLAVASAIPEVAERSTFKLTLLLIFETLTPLVEELSSAQLGALSALLLRHERVITSLLQASSPTLFTNTETESENPLNTDAGGGTRVVALGGPRLSRAREIILNLFICFQEQAVRFAEGCRDLAMAMRFVSVNLLVLSALDGGTATSGEDEVLSLCDVDGIASVVESFLGLVDGVSPTEGGVSFTVEQNSSQLPTQGMLSNLPGTFDDLLTTPLVLKRSRLTHSQLEELLKLLRRPIPARLASALSDEFGMLSHLAGEEIEALFTRDARTLDAANKQHQRKEMKGKDAQSNRLESDPLWQPLSADAPEIMQGLVSKYVSVASSFGVAHERASTSESTDVGADTTGEKDDSMSSEEAGMAIITSLREVCRGGDGEEVYVPQCRCALRSIATYVLRNCEQIVSCNADRLDTSSAAVDPTLDPTVTANVAVSSNAFFSLVPNLFVAATRATRQAALALLREAAQQRVHLPTLQTFRFLIQLGDYPELLLDTVVTAYLQKLFCATMKDIPMVMLVTALTAFANGAVIRAVEDAAAGVRDAPRGSVDEEVRQEDEFAALDQFLRCCDEAITAAMAAGKIDVRCALAASTAMYTLNYGPVVPITNGNGALVGGCCVDARIRGGGTVPPDAQTRQRENISFFDRVVSFVGSKVTSATPEAYSRHTADLFRTKVIPLVAQMRARDARVRRALAAAASAKEAAAHELVMQKRAERLREKGLADDDEGEEQKNGGGGETSAESREELAAAVEAAVDTAELTRVSTFIDAVVEHGESEFVSPDLAVVYDPVTHSSVITSTAVRQLLALEDAPGGVFFSAQRFCTLFGGVDGAEWASLWPSLYSRGTGEEIEREGGGVRPFFLLIRPSVWMNLHDPANYLLPLSTAQEHGWELLNKINDTRADREDTLQRLAQEYIDIVADQRPDDIKFFFALFADKAYKNDKLLKTALDALMVNLGSRDDRGGGGGNTDDDSGARTHTIVTRLSGASISSILNSLALIRFSYYQTLKRFVLSVTEEQWTGVDAATATALLQALGKLNLRVPSAVLSISERAVAIARLLHPNDIAVIVAALQQLNFCDDASDTVMTALMTQLAKNVHRLESQFLRYLWAAPHAHRLLLTDAIAGPVLAATARDLADNISISHAGGGRVANYGTQKLAQKVVATVRLAPLPRETINANLRLINSVLDSANVRALPASTGMSQAALEKLEQLPLGNTETFYSVA